MTNYPDDADGSVLSDLAASGVDMSQPLLIEYAVAAPDEEAATAIADALSKAGYDGHAEFDEGEPDSDEDDDEEFGPSWTVYANVTMVPVYDEIIRIQEELDQLAEPFGGYADGWGVMLDAE